MRASCLDFDLSLTDFGACHFEESCLMLKYDGICLI